MFLGKPFHTDPGPALLPFLASVAYDAQPKSDYLINEAIDALGVARDSMVLQPSLHDRTQPPRGFTQGAVHAFAKPNLYGGQRRAHAFGDGKTSNREPAMRSRLRTEVRKAEKIKRFRASGAASAPVVDRVASELNQTRLTFVQFQAELGKTCSECFQTCLCLGMRLKPNHEIVRVADNHDIALAAVSSPPMHPKVQDIVKEHVRK